MASLKVITLNIWNYNRFDERKHHIVSFLRDENADVVALQEIRDDARINVEGDNQAEQLNEALGYPHKVFVATMDLNEVDNSPLLPRRNEGLAVLSKHPIVKTRLYELARHPDDKFTRKLLHCRVKTPGGMVDVVVVHFSPHVLFSELHLIDAIRLLSENGIEAIMLGDFNIYRPEIIEQHAHGYQCSFAHTRYISYPSKQWTLDYILIPRLWRFRSVSAKGEGLSDHRAVVAEIQF